MVVDFPTWVPIVALLVCTSGFAFAYVQDEIRKSVVLFYNLETDSQKDYQSLHEAFDQLGSCSRVWHVEAAGAVKDRKYHAGATSVVQRKPISLSKSPPPFVKTNIDVPAIPGGQQTLYFFPDRLLVFEPNGVGAVGYRDLVVEIQPTRFVEDGSVPEDATIVGRTWRYVNKKGEPDRRFKDNRELPIALYEDIHFKSKSGLNELVQFSKSGVGQAFGEAIGEPHQSDHPSA
ncbi:MAG: hypothetical protein ACE5JS_20665 [Nitrospinota bacterium]